MTAAPVASAPNPLLVGRGLPPFDEVQPAHVVPAISQLLETLQAEFEQLEQTVEVSWTGLVEPLQSLSERLSWSWGIVGHLMGVKNSPELREAYEAAQPQVIQFATKLGQSQPIYEAFKALRNSDAWESFADAQQRIIESAIRDAELSGVGLEGDRQARFNEIQMELAGLSTQFSNHVLDATKAFSLTLTNPEDVDGLPPSWLGLAAQAARDAGSEDATPDNGPWRLTLDFPSFGPFMKYSTRR
ncbi:MAG: M3 family peptidase, partial [Cyanobacteria bacterium J06648_11]